LKLEALNRQSWVTIRFHFHIVKDKIFESVIDNDYAREDVWIKVVKDLSEHCSVADWYKGLGLAFSQRRHLTASTANWDDCTDSVRVN
jgi:hypothetical protein